MIAIRPYKGWFKGQESVSPRVKIIQVETEEHKRYGELFWENFSAMLEQSMAKLQQFAPPSGRLLLGEYQAKIAGCAGLRKIDENVSEINRMYVRPEYQKMGIARSLLKLKNQFMKTLR